MFYKQIKDAFEQIDAIYRPFARNIGLVWLFCVLVVAGLDSTEVNSNSFGLHFGLAIVGTVINLISMYWMATFRRVYFYYLLNFIGFIFCLSSLMIGAFELIGWSNYFASQGIIWGLFSLSTLFLLYTYNISISDDFLKKYVGATKLAKYQWDINRDIFAEANKNHGIFLKLLRYFVAPIAPAFGMVLSRNLQGEQELIALGLMILFLSVILFSGYLKFFVLACKVYYWQKKTDAEIEIVDSRVSLVN